MTCTTRLAAKSNAFPSPSTGPKDMQTPRFAASELARRTQMPYFRGFLFCRIKTSTCGLRLRIIAGGGLPAEVD